jgi:hypothetical protein
VWGLVDLSIPGSAKHRTLEFSLFIFVEFAQVGLDCNDIAARFLDAGNCGGHSLVLVIATQETTAVGPSGKVVNLFHLVCPSHSEISLATDVSLLIRTAEDPSNIT